MRLFFLEQNQQTKTLHDAAALAVSNRKEAKTEEKSAKALVF